MEKVGESRNREKKENAGELRKKEDIGDVEKI